MRQTDHAVVLVVDDQRDSLQFLQRVLAQCGYEVVPADGGGAALASAGARPPDLALLDLRMPGMDGTETSRRLRKLPGLADLPVIFLTGASDRLSFLSAFDAGAVDFVSKPFRVEELLARVRTHLELKRARDRSMAMLRERDEVVDLLFHDLKNPLSNALFAHQLLRRQLARPDAAQQRELLDEAGSAIREALDTIGGFMQRRATGARLRSTQVEPLELAELAAVVVERNRACAALRRIRIGIEGAALARGDRSAVASVLQNLLANALRSAPEGSEVTIAVEAAHGNYCRCAVLDRGPGVPAAEQRKLFRRFARLGNAARDRDSSGLGLALAKETVTRLGGQLWYEPREGGGAIFAFALPKWAMAGDAA